MVFIGCESQILARIGVDAFEEREDEVKRVSEGVFRGKTTCIL